MANYGVGVYGASKYGAVPKLAYSVEPMGITVINFSEVYVSWQVPSGTFSRWRLVRNQNSFPEHAEDGVIVYDEVNTTVSRVLFRDGEDYIGKFAITSGRPIYYCLFLFTGDNKWVKAGAINAVIPSDHGMQSTLMNTLPRVFTSKEQSPVSEVNTSSYLYSFLDAFSFTLEEFLTYLDLLNPDHTLLDTPAELIPLENGNLGLTGEPGLPVKNQKALIREAIYMYTHKGTKNALTTYVKALTGYDSVVTVSPNLLLNVQDSTFYKSIGNWSATAGTLSSSTDLVPASVTTSIDGTYTCKIVASGAGSMTLGKDSPIFKGVPLIPATTYTLSAQVKSPASAGTITPSITFYDRTGTAIGSDVTGSSTAANNTWKQISMTARASHKELQAISTATGTGSAITYTTVNNHTFVTGTSITVTGFSTAGFNVTNATVTGVTANTFTVSGAQSGTTAVGETGSAVNDETDATYAGIKLAWSAAGTYYVDLVCMQVGSSVSYDDARAVTITLNPDKTNYIQNPSFETNVTDSWTKTGTVTITQDTSVPPLVFSGTKSAKLVATGNWTYTAESLPVSAGSYYTASAYVKASSALTVTLIGKDIDGNVVDNDVYPQGTFANWTRIEVTDLVGSQDTIVTYDLQFSGGTGTFYIDSVQFERSPFATEYFDGSLTTDFGAVWTGTTDNSTTAMYYGKNYKIPRLAYTLSDWIPTNTFWRIVDASGTEYTNITAV